MNSGAEDTETATTVDPNEVAIGESIAVAGAKGGCGVSTVALGLAGAFGRMGRQVVVVDADRQLPNIHTMADVDREPTLAAVSQGAMLSDIAQPRVGNPDVRVLPPPTDPNQSDFGMMLNATRGSQYRVIIDCPSGFGPDFVEPAKAADTALVVTGTGDLSVAAVERTIDVLTRLDTAVKGAIVTRAEEVPGSLQSKLPVPVLGSVPESQTADPLDDSAVRSALDEVLYCIDLEYTDRMDSASRSDG